MTSTPPVRLDRAYTLSQINVSRFLFNSLLTGLPYSFVYICKTIQRLKFCRTYMLDTFKGIFFSFLNTTMFCLILCVMCTEKIILQCLESNVEICTENCVYSCFLRHCRSTGKSMLKKKYMNTCDL